MRVKSRPAMRMTASCCRQGLPPPGGMAGIRSNSAWHAIALTIALATVAGCSHRPQASPARSPDRHLAAGAHFDMLTWSWQPVRVRDGFIVAAGSIRLPEPIRIPPGLKPVSPLALYRYKQQPHEVTGAVVFFPPNEEYALLKWAYAFPNVTSGTGFRWDFDTKDRAARSRHAIFCKQPTRSRISVLLPSVHIPSAVPELWIIRGVGQTRRFILAAFWSGQAGPAKLAPGGSANSPDSPIRGFGRTVSFVLDYTNRDTDDRNRRRRH
jgi:hypothetical protein